MGKEKRVIALGFFDGVHLGHAALLWCTNARAEELGVKPFVLSFDTHPGQFISGETVPLINSPEGRVDLIRRLFGIYDVLLLHFDGRMRQMGWREFVAVLQEEFGAVHLVCGRDFRFGYRGEGTAELLQEACETRGMGCDVVEEVCMDGGAVSSSRIRTLLQDGALAEANRLLGHPHTLVDTVRHGYKLGRTLGAPTINMLFPEGVLKLPFGVYATRVYIGDEAYYAVTNVGIRPTAGKREQVTVESYILDFAADLYGREVRVEFFHYLRPEIKFEGLEALKTQIKVDVEATRAYFDECEIDNGVCSK